MSPLMSSRNQVTRRLERLLWIVAAAALGAFGFVFLDAHMYQARLNRTFDAARALGTAVRVIDEPTKPAAGAVVSPARLPQHLARLEIPRLNLSAMVLDGVDSRTLRFGIGRIPGTAWPGENGNAAIAGHRDTFFRGLAAIDKNDRITVQTSAGDYLYIVDSIRIVNPNAVEVLKDAGRPSLTLITCYPFYFVGPAPKRFVVRAFLAEESLPQPLP